MSDPSKSGMTSAKAFVSISIDVDAGSSTADIVSSNKADAIHSVIEELTTQANQSRIPTTWAFCAPAAMPAIRQIASSPVGHELALLADVALAKSELSRSDIMQAVVHPLQSAADEGMTISTLALPYAWQPRHFDLMTKYGLTVIRTPHVFSSQTTTGIRAICHGLWQVPVSAILQNSGWMASIGQWRCMRRAIDQAVQHGQWCHLRIDAASIARGDAGAGLRAVARLFQHLHQLRSAGQISMETLHDAATRLAPKRNALSAQSILRAA
jgi:hypothetical protein